MNGRKTMFGKLMSGLGLGGVSIDTILHNVTLQAGGTVSGEICFKGASSSKKINGLSLQLMTTAEVESGDSEYNSDLCLQRWQISGAFDLPANQEHRIPFSIQLPLETPITEVQCHFNKTKVWIYTHLDVDWGIDGRDRDFLKIIPMPAMNAFLQAMQHCGFNLFSVDVEKGYLRGPNFQSTIGCYQELEFKPTGFFNSINEVEVSFVPDPHHDQIHVMLEVDKVFRNDRILTLTIPNHNFDIQDMVFRIKQMLGI